MTKAVFRALLFVAAAFFGLSAASDSPTAALSKPFLGTWEGRHEGKLYTVLKLNFGDSLTGTIASGEITVDDKTGHILSVQEEASEDVPISDVKISADILSFKADDNGEVMEYKMKINASGQAELSIVGAPASIKPFVLKKL